MTVQQSQLLARLGLAVLDTIAEAGNLGAPAGILYAALQSHGASLNQFESFMAGLTGKGLLTKSGQCFYITAEGERIKGVLQTRFATEPA